MSGENGSKIVQLLSHGKELYGLDDTGHLCVARFGERYDNWNEVRWWRMRTHWMKQEGEDV